MYRKLNVSIEYTEKGEHALAYTKTPTSIYHTLQNAKKSYKTHVLPPSVALICGPMLLEAVEEELVRDEEGDVPLRHALLEDGCGAQRVGHEGAREAQRPDDADDDHALVILVPAKHLQVPCFRM